MSALLLTQTPEEFMREQELKQKDCRTPLSRRIPILKASRESRNYQTIQQAIFTALLSEYCTITIKQPARKSVVTQQFMRMRSLDFGYGEVIVPNEYLKQRCGELRQEDLETGVIAKTAARRYQNNKKIELLHLLIDLLSIVGGYEFESRFIEGKARLNKQENIKKVILNGKVLLEGDELSRKGEKINMIISERLANQKGDLIIQKGDCIRDIIFE